VYPRGPPTPYYPVPNTKVFPNSAVGRVMIPMVGGVIMYCSATLVGKHHIITASHCGGWHNFQDDSPPEPMIFQPGYNLGQMYPDSNVIHSYWIRKVQSSSLSDYGGGDWLVGVLDRDMEDTNGIFGQLQYDAGWDGLYLWDVCGYPRNVRGTSLSTEQQFVQSSMAITRAITARYGEVYYLEGYSRRGFSGAPVYGMLKGLPQLIGTLSGRSSPFTMIVHGGPPMFELIAKAIEEYP
jgi:hypothetical protein